MVTTLLLILILTVNQCANVPDKRIITTLKYSNKHVQLSVVNGVPAKWSQVPYIVSIKENLVKVSSNKYLWSNLCGGAIISLVKVLTAAHCFESNDFEYKKHPEKLRVVAGDFMTQIIHTGSTFTADNCQWRQIVAVALHPHFYFPDNDLAVVVVDEPWRLQDNVNYILPAVRRNLDYPIGCTAAGFGSTVQGLTQKISPILLVGQVFPMSRKNCTSIWGMDMDKFICTYSYMSDVSQGDSGGPLICKGTEDPVEKENYPNAILVGVVSGKNYDKTTIFTRLAEYRDWIDRAPLPVSMATLVVNFLLLSVATLIINFLLS